MSQLVTKSGYTLEITPCKSHPGWYYVSGYNPVSNTWAWGKGSSESRAIQECLNSINNHQVYEGSPQ